MCGIAGVFFARARRDFPIQFLADSLRHRGPDDEGYALFGADRAEPVTAAGEGTQPGIPGEAVSRAAQPSRVILAHRRLSIIDLTAAGHQPMADASGRYWIVYNGEIYNYPELKAELAASGAKFRSSTDTEVILESYKRWGEDCLHRFNGMWAFALWDRDKQTLFLARDRFGVKPLYYCDLGGNFYFASEIKALLRVPGLKAGHCEEAVFDYLAWGQCDGGRRTFFAGIEQIEPGCRMLVDARGDRRYSRWYSLSGRADTAVGPESPREFLEKMEDAVRVRLRADVPVGSCLSGGLDSSSIVTLAGRRLSAMETFSSCFMDPKYDERKFILPVVSRSGALGHYVFPGSGGFWEELDSLISQQDEPFGSTSLYAQWCVMREARRAGVPVLLDGQGGDELLGGYPRYRVNYAAGRLASGKPEPRRELIRAAAVLAFDRLPAWGQEELAGRLALRSGLIDRAWAGRHRERSVEYVLARSRAQCALRETLLSDFLRYSLPALLRYEDRNSMRFSVEARLPFLDYRLVEWVFSLEEEAKIAGGESKKILRDALRGLLPESVRQRRDKMGFVTPERDWMRDGKERILEMFRYSSQAAIACWVDVRQLRLRLEQGRWNRFMWRCVNLERWLSIFFGASKKQHENTHSKPVLSA